MMTTSLSVAHQGEGKGEHVCWVLVGGGGAPNGPVEEF